MGDTSTTSAGSNAALLPAAKRAAHTELLPKRWADLSLGQLEGTAKQLLTFADVPHILAVLYIVDHFKQNFFLLFHSRCCITESLYPVHG